MPTIQIRRGTGFDDRMRACKILTDAEQRRMIRQNETQSYEVADGVHEVELRVDWCASPVLAVACNGVDAALECGPARKGLLTIFYAILWPKQWIWLRRLDGAAPGA